MIEQKELHPSGCEICHQDTNVLNMIPRHKPDGSLITLACTQCSIEKGMFCIEHQRPHLGFDDGTTACKSCIDEEVEKRGGEIAELFFNKVEMCGKKDEITKTIDEYDDLISSITHEPRSKIIFRAIVTASLRLKLTPEEVVNQTMEKGPEFLLPQFREI